MGFELTTLVDCTCNCKSNYHTIMTAFKWVAIQDTHLNVLCLKNRQRILLKHFFYGHKIDCLHSPTQIKIYIQYFAK
jgi:hypothetical protein